jgi:hypothetical protein
VSAWTLISGADRWLRNLLLATLVTELAFVTLLVFSCLLLLYRTSKVSGTEKQLVRLFVAAFGLLLASAQREGLAEARRGPVVMPHAQ